VRDGVLYLTIPKLTDDESSFQVQWSEVTSSASEFWNGTDQSSGRTMSTCCVLLSLWIGREWQRSTTPTVLLLLFFLFCFCHMRTVKHGASDLLSLTKTKRTCLIDGLNVSGLKNNNVESFSP
jgi:hypothetical protein